jgi:hypothetical protein
LSGSFNAVFFGCVFFSMARGLHRQVWRAILKFI